MPERTSYQHGIPSWIDLSSTDPIGAQNFYGTLFGWDFEENPTDGDGVYVMAFKDGKAAAGLMQQSSEQAQMGLPSLWNTYVTVDDVEQTVGKVADAGGSVMAPPFDVMDSGRMAVIQDPTMAVLCLWEPKEHIGAQVVNEHGALVWNEIMTPGIEDAAKFYGELFGWTTDAMPMEDGSTYTVFMQNTDGIAGAMAPPEQGVPPHWGTVFAVDDCDQAAASVRSAGGTVIKEPFDVAVGRLAVIADPQGAVFQVMQLSDEQG